MAQTKRGTSREWVDARMNGDKGWLSALVAGFDLTSPSGLSGLSDAFNPCAENCQRDICVTVYRGRAKNITKFTKSTYPSFVAYRCTVPFSQRKSVSAPSRNLCPCSKVNLQQFAESSMLPYCCLQQHDESTDTCLTTFGNQGSQETLPDEREARVTS